MGKWGKRNEVSTTGRDLVCATCGKDLGKLEKDERTLGMFANGGPVIHCDGRSYAFGARMWDEGHHTIKMHPACWKCGHPLGCRTCSGIEAELMCQQGAGCRSDGQWFGHGGMGPVLQRVAFVERGPLRHQNESEYPEDWQIERRKYQLSHDALAAPRNVSLRALTERIGREI